MRTVPCPCTRTDGLGLNGLVSVLSCTWYGSRIATQIYSLRAILIWFFVHASHAHHDTMAHHLSVQRFSLSFSSAGKTTGTNSWKTECLCQITRVQMLQFTSKLDVIFKWHTYTCVRLGGAKIVRQNNQQVRHLTSFSIYLNGKNTKICQHNQCYIQIPSPTPFRLQPLSWHGWSTDALQSGISLFNTISNSSGTHVSVHQTD